MSEMATIVEAVIISGPRRDEMIYLPHEALTEVSDEDIRTLNEALDQLDAAIDRFSTEVRATNEALREHVESS